MKAGPLPLAVAAALFAAPAAAHEVLPGVTGLPSLLLHPFLAVDTMLCMLAMGLVAGAGGSLAAVAAGSAVIPAGVMLGLAAQSLALTIPGLWRLPLLVALLLGAAAAAGRRPGPSAVVATTLVTAFAVGLGIVRERAGWPGSLEAVAATTAALGLALLVVAVPRLLLPRSPAAVGARIAGAWIAAIALLGLMSPAR